MSSPETGEVPRGRVESASKLNGRWLPPQQHQLSSLSNSPAPSSIHAVNLPQMSTFVSTNHNSNSNGDGVNRHNQASSSRGVISKINVASPEVAHDNNKSKVIELARLISGETFFIWFKGHNSYRRGILHYSIKPLGVTIQTPILVCCSGIRT